MLSSSLLLAAFLAGANALPALSTRHLAYTVAPSFTLISEEFTTGENLAFIGNWSLAGLHTGAGLDTAALIPPNEAGRQFYANGTVAAFNSNQTDILTSGGTPPFPFGLIIPSAADSVADPLGRRVQVNAGSGTPGVRIGFVKTPADPYPVPYLQYVPDEPLEGATFFACNTTYFPGQPPVPVVFWRNGTAATPEECAEIRLYPQCDGGFTDGESRPYAFQSPCFPSVEAWETAP